MCDGVSEAVLIAGVAASAASAAKSSADASAAADAQQGDLNRQTDLSRSEFDKRMALVKASDARVSQLQKDQYDTTSNITTTRHDDEAKIDDDTARALLANNKATYDTAAGLQKDDFAVREAADRGALDQSYGLLNKDFATRDAISADQDAATAKAWAQRGDVQGIYDNEKAAEQPYATAITNARASADDAVTQDYGKESQARLAYRDLVANENTRQDAFRGQADATVQGLVNGIGQPAFDADRASAQTARDNLVAAETTAPARPAGIDHPGQSSLIQDDLTAQLNAAAARSAVKSRAQSAVSAYGDALAGGARRISDAGTTLSAIDQDAKTSAGALGSELAAQSTRYRDAQADAELNTNDAVRAVDTNRQVQLNVRQAADNELAIRDAALQRGLDAAKVMAQLKSGNIDAQTADLLKEVQAQHDAAVGASSQRTAALTSANQNYGAALDSLLKQSGSARLNTEDSYFSNLGNTTNNYFGGMANAEGSYTQNLVGDSNNYENQNKQLTDFQIANTRPGTSLLGTALSVAGNAGVSYGLSGLKSDMASSYGVGSYKAPTINLKYQSV